MFGMWKNKSSRERKRGRWREIEINGKLNRWSFKILFILKVNLKDNVFKNYKFIILLVRFWYVRKGVIFRCKFSIV